MRKCDVGHMHFDQLSWDHIQSDMIKVLITRDYKKGALSEEWQGHREDLYDPSAVYTKRRIAFITQQRELKTELMKPYADYIIDYDDLTKGQEILEWSCPKLCFLFGIKKYTFTTNFRKFPEIRIKR